jgi:hypothetical protein
MRHREIGIGETIVVKTRDLLVRSFILFFPGRYEQLIGAVVIVAKSF